MNSEPTDSPADGEVTLGDLLYADAAKTRVSEADWVAIVRAVAAGDQQALRSLYERTHRIVFTLTMRIVNSREAAEEVTVDVFHDVWRRAPQYDAANGTVVGWIMNQARSRAIDRLRFDRRKKRVVRADAAAAEASPEGPDEILDAGELARVMRTALATLTRAEREAIEIAFFSELTYAEVAERLAQPLGTIKTRIRSGLGKLRQALVDKE
jgi:RNA polymerase sigma-70 factor (ECF subfamily)